MSTEMIPVKKLSDSIVGDFYPLAADKGTIFTEDIPVRGNIGDYIVGDVIHKADSLFDVISKLVGPNGYDDRYILKTSIDVTELTDDTTRVPCSKLVKTKFDEINANISIIIGQLIKHELITEAEYQRRLVAGEINDDTIYFTYTEGYKVTFKGFYGDILKTQLVEKGKDATAPIPPTIEGYIFNGWDKSFTNVQSDLVVNAIYTSDDALYIITEDGRNVMTEDGSNLLIAEQDPETNNIFNRSK